MLQNKILTISVAAYNVEEYIEECLLLFAQDGVADRCEVFVIDDGGTDASKEIAEHFERDYPNTFKVIHKENGGWGSTVNTGISFATGKYFKQLDGDDYFESGSMVGFLDALEELDSDMVLSPFATFISDTKETIKVDKPADCFRKDIYREYQIGDLTQNEPIQMHQCTFKTELLQNNEVWLLEHAFYTDVEFVVKALCYVKTIAFVPMTVYCYRTARAGQSVSIDGLRKHYKEHERVLFNSATFLRDKTQSPGYALSKKRLNDMIATHYLIYCILGQPNQHLHELKAFDSKLKKEYPELYQQESKRINLLRKTHFLAYYPLCRYEARRSRGKT